MRNLEIIYRLILYLESNLEWPRCYGHCRVLTLSHRLKAKGTKELLFRYVALKVECRAELSDPLFDLLLGLLHEVGAFFNLQEAGLV